jgi:putative serine protease PepD
VSTDNEGAAATPTPAGRGDEDTAVLRPVTDSPPPEETRTTGLRRVEDTAPAEDAASPSAEAPPAPGAGGAGGQAAAPADPRAGESGGVPPSFDKPEAPVAGPPGVYVQDSGPAGPQPPYGGGPHWGGGPGDGSTPPPPPGAGGPHTPWGTPPMPPGPPGGGKSGKSRFGLLVVAAVVAALVAGVVGGGIGFWAAGGNGDSSTTVSSDSGSQALNRAPDSVAGIAAKALPSVVTIQFRGNGEAGTGTGFIFDKEGHILTNNHVVAAAAKGGKITATFSDGKKYDAEIVGRAQGYDVAVIKLKNPDGHELKPLPLGDSDKVRVGDATIAIGAPYGLSGTVTTGIISAKDRPVASSDGQGSEASYMNALQTDASINPGNSGGPLMNAKGEVIGINSAIQSGGGGGGGLGGGQPGSVGLGFAIPVNQAKRVAQQLIKTGEPVYPVIGVRVTMGNGNGMPSSGDGAVIAQRVNQGQPVTPGGPADKAGLKAGDKIVAFDGTKIDSGPTLIATIWAHKPGDTVPITYERNGEKHTTQITLGSRKGDS